MQKLWLLLAAALVVPAQAPTSSPVTIQFRAVGEDGQPVTDLKAHDILLKVNGKPRTLASLTLVQNTSMGATTSTLALPYATNTLTQSNRNFYILVDDDSITTGREGDLRDAMQALTSEIADGDRIGLMTTQGQVNITPTADVPRVAVAARGIAGKGSAVESRSDAQCRSSHVLSDVRTLLATAAGPEPPTIVLFSGGLSAPADKVVQVGRSTRTAVGGQAAPQSALEDMCAIRPDDFESIGRQADASGADVYVFDLTQAMATHSSGQDDGLSSLAGVTGGEFISIGGNAQAAMSRLLRETSAYYVASFDAEPADRTGQPTRLEVKSTHEHVDVRAPHSVIIPKDATNKGNAPKDMLRVALEYRDLPLRAAGYCSRNAGGGDLKVVAAFEPLEASATIVSASVALFDETNTLKKQWTAQPADLTKRPVLGALTAAPGAYRMRVAAVDSSGHAGTVDYPITVDLPRADPLTLSSLVLGTQVNGRFAPRLDFGGEPVAIGYLEMYGVPKGANVGLSLDVANTDEGAPLATADTTVAQGSAADARIAFGGFSIENLQPGDYLMRATVTLNGKPVGRIVRTLRKSK